MCSSPTAATVGAFVNNQQSTLLQVVTVGLGSAENARFFSKTLDYPLDNLYADPTGACYKALGFSPGGFGLVLSCSRRPAPLTDSHALSASCYIQVCEAA